ncbi:MAG TPA: preprotein translocase subunit SecE [Bacillota bacterium]|jgi:preprotein translocase subunit SecE|nr:preprotein translocase subunit SecE [Bacillota bacterium]HOL08948.1 preprotein translocase subunit SecE [Bacillota bacterium]HPO96498.1 preprotein translocase subunit SecE [Bacillota bacterium]
MQQPAVKEAPFGGFKKFFRNVVAELKKVNWPSRKELSTYTVVVIVTVLVVSLVIYLWDWILAFIFKNMGLYR